MQTTIQASAKADPLTRAWYAAPLDEFFQTDPDTIVGRLALSSGFADQAAQKAAWLAQIDFLQDSLAGLDGSLFLEFNIPRMGRRIDTVLLLGSLVFVVEFKVGERTFQRAALDQVWDYALDLKNFHQGSHSAFVAPILIATEATASPPFELHLDEDKVFRPIAVHREAFRRALELTSQRITGTELDRHRWSSASYCPTPTILEAARALYAQHSVEEIARYDAGAQNLHTTSCRVEQLIDEAKAYRRKVICFVTGVPGAGKTLVGLNLATRHRHVDEATHSVFLSGNGPLVNVLREALTRDEFARQKQDGVQVRKGMIRESVKAFIQNVHHFRDDALVDPGPPSEHVAIFDEAQRAWNLERTASFMRRKKDTPGFSYSEPEFLISCMDRHSDWAAIVCLVGGGQEINTGEAGIDAWLEAIHSSFPHWHMYISSRLTDSEYAAGKAVDAARQRGNTYYDDCLHLSASMRSFRAENVSAFVKALLDCEKRDAREHLSRFVKRYPIAVTRDLSLAKKWVRARARGTERYGLVASSKAQRLKPHAIDVRVDVDPVHWFLNGVGDTRSSYYLEDAATEFQVQGLELDWACVTWDGDLRFTGSGWSFHDFRGSRWCKIKSPAGQRYLRNAYRVLLTRARQGMVLFVPLGDDGDPTRRPEFYNSTFDYLTDVGVPVL